MVNSNRIFLSFLLFFAQNVCAENPWTLQQCIDRAQEYNIQIKLQKLNVENEKVSMNQNAAGMLPSINASAGQNYFFGRSIDPFTNVFKNQDIRNNSFSVSGSIPLFQGLQLQNALRQSQLTYMSAKYDQQKIQNDVSINVVTFYLQLLYNQEILEVTTQQLAATDTQRYRMKRMFELGSASKANYLDLESQYASEQVRLVQAQAQYDQSVLTLTQLLELETTKGFSVIRPEVTVPGLNTDQLSVEKVYTAALSNQPDIKSSEFKVKSSEKGLAAARGGYYPRIFGTGGISTNFSTSSQEITSYIFNPPSQFISGFTSAGDTVYTLQQNVDPVFSRTPFRSQLTNNLGKSVGIALQIPILNSWSVRSNVHRAKVGLEQTRLNLEQTRKNLYKSVQQAVNDAVSSYNKFIAGQRSVAALEETFNYNKARFTEGLISAFDYLTSKNNYQRAQADLIQAKYDYIFRLKIIDFYLGKPLAF